MNRRARRLLAGGSLTLLAAAPLMAQLPGPPTREELERARPPVADPRGRQRLSIEGDVERAPCPLADPRFAGTQVTISQARFNVPGGIDPALLDGAWTEYRDTEVPIATLCEIRDRAATILRRAGYLAAVQVPPQRIEQGVVTFDVLAARIVRIEVRGDAGPSEALIADYLSELGEQPLLNIREAERNLLLARDLPGYDVRLTLRPAGSAPGEVIGEVTVTRQAFEIDANVQNLGSQDIGRFGGLLRARVYGITGLGDATYLSIFSTSDFDEQQVVQAGHEFRIGRHGLTFGGDFTYAWSQPSLGIPETIRSETQIGTIRLGYPLRRSQTDNGWLWGGLDIVDQDTGFGSLAISEDHLRAAWLRLDLDSADPASVSGSAVWSAAEPRWRMAASVEVRHGLDILDASEGCGNDFVACVTAGVPPSRIEADPTAFVVRADAYGEWRPVPTLALSLAPRMQYAPDPLFSFEEFSAGNYTVGRGYDPGQLIGDSGFAVAAEARFGSLIPQSRSDFALQPFAFFDAAWVTNEDSAFDGIDPQSLFSTGGGVRASWGDRARADLTLAVPLKRAGLQSQRGDVRLLFSLTARLLPWK